MKKTDKEFKRLVAKHWPIKLIALLLNKLGEAEKYVSTNAPRKR